MKQLSVLFCFLFPLLLCAQSGGKFLIKAGKFFNSETGTFANDMAILVDGAEIVSVKSFKQLNENEKANRELIDLSNATVLPGLIDAHTHLLYKEILFPENPFPGLDLVKTLTLQGDAYRAIYGAARAKAYLEAGITGVQDLGNSGMFADVALRKAIDEGIVIGPRMRCAGRGLSSEGGQIPGVIFKHRHIIDDEYRIVKGVDDAMQAVRENITQGADVIKIFSNNTPNVTALTIEEMRSIVREAHRYNIRVTAHATDNQAIHNAVIAGVDAIEHGYQVDDTTLSLMAKRGVFLIPTDGDSLVFGEIGKIVAPNDPNVAKNIQAQRKFLGARLMRAVKQGVTIVAGSDDYLDAHLPFSVPSKRTLIGYYESGMSIIEILRSATIHAGVQVNAKNRIGVLKAGYLADIIAVDIDLDKNINAIMNVHFVMKDGRVFVHANKK